MHFGGKYIRPEAARDEYRFPAGSQLFPAAACQVLQAGLPKFGLLAFGLGDHKRTAT